MGKWKEEARTTEVWLRDGEFDVLVSTTYRKRIRHS